MTQASNKYIEKKKQNCDKKKNTSTNYANSNAFSPYKHLNVDETPSKAADDKWVSFGALEMYLLKKKYGSIVFCI